MSTDPNDQLLLRIRGAVAEYERPLISERMRRGKVATPRGRGYWTTCSIHHILRDPAYAGVTYRNRCHTITARRRVSALRPVGSGISHVVRPDEECVAKLMCPGNQQSGGTRKNAKTRMGSKFLRRALIEAAHAATRFRRLAYRRGKPKAAVAISHAILVTAYQVLVRQEVDQERDLEQDGARRRARLEKRAVANLVTLGYKVSLTPARPAA